MKVFKDNERKQFFLSGLLIVIILALYVEVNVLISKSNIKSIDITQDKVYTISEASKEKISKLNKIVKITMVNFNKYDNYTYADDALYVAKQFDEYSNKISIDYYDDGVNDTTNAQYPYMIFTCENNSRQVSLDELYQYRYNTLGENQEEMYNIEPMIINSIMCVSGDTWNNIYICLDKTVYSEKMFKSFVNIASILGAETFGINLSEDKKIPEDCTLLVIPPLVSTNEDGSIVSLDFSEDEKNAIIDYINKGGNILFLQESKSLVNGESPNLDYILGLYGVSISEGIVCQETNTIQNIPSYINPQINGDNDILKNTNKDSKVSLFDAGTINMENDEQLNVSHKIILRAGKDAFVREDLNNSSLTKTEKDRDASDAVIGVYIEKSVGDNKSCAIVYSNSVFATNNPVVLTDSITNKKVAVETISLDNNSELTADTINALINNDGMSFESKSKYDLVPSINILTDGITLKVIFVIPMIIIIIGYFVWRYRKNKK